MAVYAGLDPEAPPLAYLDGVSLGADEALVIAAIWGLEDVPDRPTRLLHVQAEGVSYLDYPSNITSLAVLAGPTGQRVYALTKQNDIVQVFPRLGEAVRAGRQGGGRLLRLHSDGETLFAFGMNGQVLRLTADGEPGLFDEGLYHAERSPHALQLRDMAGSGAWGHVVIDAMGRVFERSAAAWKVVDLPVGVALEQVIAAARPGHFWICGDRGLLFGYGEDEMTLIETGVTTGFWGMAVFGGQVWLATFDGLYGLDLATGNFAPLDLGIDLAPICFRLDASAKGLLSVGPRDICMFDGDRWRRVRVPSNDRS